jgi:hypothetical protein
MGFSTNEMYEWAEKIWAKSRDKSGLIVSVFEFYDEAVKDAMNSPYVTVAKPPEDYACHHCKRRNAKLWREYNTFADQTKLLCKKCAHEDQAKSIEESRKVWAKLGGERPESDQIGGMVPAVPDFNGSYWGYTSVPSDGVHWWKTLPD